MFQEKLKAINTSFADKKDISSKQKVWKTFVF